MSRRSEAANELSQKFSGASRSALANAWRRGHAFAIWSRPGGGQVRGLVSLRDMQRDTPLSFDAPLPSFAISKFASEDGRRCDLMLGDAILDSASLRFVEADGTITADPSTPAQQAFMDQLSEAGGPILPVDGRHGWPSSPPAVTGEDHYKGFVAAAVEAIGSGDLAKIVASRVVPAALPDGVDLLEVFDALVTAYEHAFVCLVSVPREGVWVLATPETLINVDAEGLSTMALAGTQPVDADADLKQVTWSDKFIGEQGLVSQYIRRALSECGVHDFREEGPKTVRAANLAHLRTDFEVATASPQFGDHLRFHEFCGQLLSRLQPTSAVCGMPRDKAQAFIIEREGYDRGYYCGVLGPVGLDGRTDLYVNLRSSQVVGNTAYLYVGAGIVSDSVPAEELQETVEKSKTLGRIYSQI